MDTERRKSLRLLAGAAAGAAGLIASTRLGATRRALAGPADELSATCIIWLNHLALLPGDRSVRTSFNAITSGVGGGLAGLTIESSTLGDQAAGGGNKVVEMGVEAPPGYLIVGVRLGYELSGTSHVNQVRLAQVEDPPSSALVLPDDPTPRTLRGPVFVDTLPAMVDPAQGPLLLSLRLSFKNTADRIVVRGLGLHLTPEH